MKPKNVASTVFVLFLVNIPLCKAILAGALPGWLFGMVNFPFGIPHILFESTWTGTQYVIGGFPINETWAFVTYFITIIGQAVLYNWFYTLWSQRLKAQSI